MYAARSIESTHATRAFPIGARAAVVWTAPDAVEREEHAYTSGDHDATHPLHVVVAREDRKLTGPDDGRPDEPTAENEVGNKQPLDEAAHHDHWEPHAWVGISLIMGFILMYLIDKVPGHASGSSRPKPSYISLNRFTLRRTSAQNDDIPDEDNSPPPESQQSSRPSSTTVGLVIHAAADGIALGASSTGSSRRLGFIVFLALMIHKAPAAFGLTSALLKQGLSKRRARTHLIIFSLAAPTGALLTWAAANIFGRGMLSGGEEGTQFATGVLLLFSGGTFL